eukprot:Em0016g951a
MADIKVVPLGAGQGELRLTLNLAKRSHHLYFESQMSVRSCILVSMGGKNVMFDCGMHMGYNDEEDYRKITVEKKGEQNFFTSQMIKDCMKKVITVNLHQTVQVDGDLELKAYYAGHVLGAAMFQIRVQNQSVVYTVLIPVFALGRAQELCILLESFWDRMNLKAPIYFTTGITEKANHYYKLFITWTNQKIRSTFVQRNMFDFKHIKPFDRSYTDQPGPMVVFATPGMLHGGQSLQIFKTHHAWLLCCRHYWTESSFWQKTIEIDKKIVNVRLSVQYMSFSAHADAKGIMQLIRQAEPKNVMLVHGEYAKMEFLKQKVLQEFANMSRLLLKRTLEKGFVSSSKRLCPVEGILVLKDEGLLPDQKVVRLSGSTLGLDSTSVTMELTGHEPAQNLLITWGLQDERLGDIVFSTLKRNLTRLL